MLRHLGSLLLVCGIAAAQQTSPVLATDPFACFAMSAPSPAGDYAELRTVNVNGPGFTQAFHLTTKRLSANAGDIRIHCFQTLAARLGDTIVARFWMRTTSPQTAEGRTTSEGPTHPPGIDGKLPAYPNNPRSVAAGALES